VAAARAAAEGALDFERSTRLFAARASPGRRWKRDGQRDATRAQVAARAALEEASRPHTLVARSTRTF
jgi:hypothetical protein